MHSRCPREHCTAGNIRGLDTNLLLNYVQTILVKITIKLILIFLSLLFNSFKVKLKHLNFVFHTEVKTKSSYKILNFIFQFMKNMKWHFGHRDCSGRVSTDGYIIVFKIQMEICKDGRRVKVGSF